MALKRGKFEGSPALFNLGKGTYALLPEIPFEVIEDDFGGGITGVKDKATGKEIDLHFETVPLTNGSEITLDLQ